MYYPYFRGKQFELVLLREMAPFLAKNKIHPVLEPVKDNLTSLRKVIEEFVKHKVKFTLIVNPLVGELQTRTSAILDLVSEFSSTGLLLGYIVDAKTNEAQLEQVVHDNSTRSFSIIHYGFAEGQNLSDVTNKLSNIKEHVFIERYASKLYQRHFKKNGVSRILIRDGFIIRKNQDYPNSEHFSDLHITYEDEGMDGFGDFLIVGDEYREAGGPAYAVAIHLSYLDREGDMYVSHFKSDRTGSPTDPAGKFLEALEKLIIAVENSNSLIYHSNACKEYKDLYGKKHFPGLGYVKKLSMQHHLELVAEFLSKA